MRVPYVLCVLLFLLLLGETSAGRKRKGEKDGGKKRDGDKLSKKRERREEEELEEETRRDQTPTIPRWADSPERLNLYRLAEASGASSAILVSEGSTKAYLDNLRMQMKKLDNLVAPSLSASARQKDKKSRTKKYLDLEAKEAGKGEESEDEESDDSMKSFIVEDEEMVEEEQSDDEKISDTEAFTERLSDAGKETDEFEQKRDQAVRELERVKNFKGKRPSRHELKTKKDTQTESQTRSGRLKKPVSSASSSMSSLWELKEDDLMEETHCEDVAQALHKLWESLMEDRKRATRQDYPSWTTPGACSSRDCSPEPAATSSSSSSSLQAEPFSSKTDEAQKKIP
uniref:Uncharacterized protein n=1 Tax=Chromera velia CCMP2878 TaxID=1169474 RepID=A0A0G4HPS1_9ALVE|eukprot:Cvel_29861.t1-p1 / transcript=Cvel_29861.t1 / gene=Cvel_29861 / organism=Chromera_velia_CCMP2878 / gene_product=hypothetical protein / transcript_product=hypothetical protein / location=Cvel_scaffold4166:6625-8024(-) / protein_length=342 / sequence_SO=supercontig / SO=protein_coding / is_pseudo=false